MSQSRIGIFILRGIIMRFPCTIVGEYVENDMGLW